ncbi:MAG: hypothetical protein Q7K57_55240 [Burkholderiaceae bacterium]|nr:hypothetical protein [Burkholderiaceae bacterium]
MDFLFQFGGRELLRLAHASWRGSNFGDLEDLQAAKRSRSTTRHGFAQCDYKVEVGTFDTAFWLLTRKTVLIRVLEDDRNRSAESVTDSGCWNNLINPSRFFVPLS